MVSKSKFIYIIGFIITLVLFFVVVTFSLTIENNTIMGIKIISADKYNQLLCKKTDIFDVDFLFNNEYAAVDQTSNIIYISQNITETTKITDIQGYLSTENSNYSLVLKKDNKFDTLISAIKEGYSYSLLAITPTGNCTEYHIVFTTLPVMNINGNIVGEADNGTDLYSGEISFFDPNSEETSNYRTISSNCQWHIRGNTTAKQAKKPWKLSLKNEKDKNKNLSFCGLGSDDDWILNPMNLDDLKIREKLMMDLWNQNDMFTSQNIHMSQGEYVEVVLNGEYYGLYLLQRRLDKKYLDMEDEDILIKGRNMGTVNYVSSETMEIVYSPLSDSETYEYLEKYFDNEYIFHSNIENWIELNIYTQITCSVDNRYSKNIVMLLDLDKNKQYTINYILWDTDMSFGLWWDKSDKKYVYDYETTIFKEAYRLEYTELSKIYNSLDIDIATRWGELRKKLFSDANLYRHIDELYSIITQSGSLQRDYDKWGLYYNGDDNMENFYSFVDTRIDFLDKYYNSYLQ